ncbi:hypothetical protein [Chondromyces apiculatus]|uniref:Uncharacterized protein n=1 Tax=Chondromyces apiculatus DSM 436 TaxID=1192034 RepID=A0A017STJ4_9BACT|nr:hypothetical protein [Chondromyces apiculatus]EYF00323.1 Hypothetical protein CAP_0935 [Chondromyces apiculatus DSM 436]
MSTGSPARPSCSLSSAQLAQRRQALIPGLLERAEQVTDLDEGLRLHFKHRPGLLAELAAVIEQEQVCCSFLRFQLSIEPGAGPVDVEITGPAGTREMLRSL